MPRSGRGGEGRTSDASARILRASRGFRRETRQPEHGVAHGDTGRGGEEKEHRENREEVVGFHQEQTQDDSMAKEERRRRRAAERDKLSHRQCTGSTYCVSGMKTSVANLPITPTKSRFCHLSWTLILPPIYRTTCFFEPIGIPLKIPFFASARPVTYK